jgi:hypothetical protein
MDTLDEENYLTQSTLIRFNSHTVTREGFITMQSLLVQQDEKIGAEKWAYFYETIEGFDYEEGYRYDLDVKISIVENPPADAS